MTVTGTPSLEPEEFPYGQCKRCQGAISIPGTDGYKCSVCGWVRIQTYQTQADVARRKRKSN